MTAKKVSGLNRRNFIKLGGSGLAAAGLAASSRGESDNSRKDEASPPDSADEDEAEERNFGDIPVRPLGSTGVKVSILGLGGAHLGSVENDDLAIRMVRHALDNGVTFLDNAWEYHHGRSETLVGQALRDGYREKAFVMTKVHGRDRETTSKQIEESMARLGVDTIDLCQIHEVIYRDDPERFFENGGIEALLEAQKAGKIRFIGFTGHKSPALFTEMLQRFDGWNTAQMPVNAFDPHCRSFIKNIMPVLVEKQMGVLAMKTLGEGHLLEAGVMSAAEGLRFAWSQPISALISGMDSMEVLNQNIEHARNFKPMSQAEQQALLERTAAAAKDGRYEKYKTSHSYDGWYGRTLHGHKPPAI